MKRISAKTRCPHRGGESRTAGRTESNESVHHAVRKPAKKTRSERFLEALAGAREVVVLTHDNPDPDGIASGWGICVLIDNALRVPTRLAAGGVITRAENRALVDTLKPPLQTVGKWVPPEGAAFVVVDTVSPPRFAGLSGNEPLAAVIDHHGGETGGSRKFSFRFRDIRPGVLATSSMVCGYLREQTIEPSPALATALTYGIHADARGYGIRFSRVDRTALSWLSKFSDPERLHQIENATLSKDYFEDLVLALQSCFTYGEVALCFLPKATGAEVVGEIADLVIRCDGIHRVLCAALLGERMVFSSRTTKQGGNAASLLGKTLQDESSGSWGGHEHRAGGYLEVSQADPGKNDLEEKLRRSWLLATGAHQQQGVRLVPRKEILKALI